MTSETCLYLYFGMTGNLLHIPALVSCSQIQLDPTYYEGRVRSTQYIFTHQEHQVSDKLIIKFTSNNIHLAATCHTAGLLGKYSYEYTYFGYEYY